MIKYKNYRLSRAIGVQELVSADYFQGRHPNSRLHAHQNAWEMCVCLEGQMLIIKDGTVVPLSAGELLLVHPQTNHDIISDHKESLMFVLAFTCAGENLRPLQDAVIPITQEMTELVHKLVYELNRAFVQNEDVLRITDFVPREDAPLGAEQMICAYLEQFLVLLLREVTMHKGRVVATGQLKDAMQNYLVEQVVAYIQENYKEDLNVAKIAERFHYSRTHLSALFKSYTGISMGEYIVFIRIRRAKALLLERKMTISQIAEATGFSSPQYFSHRFAQEVGCSPSQFADKVSHPQQDSE